ncbi:MAG: Gfo/Idh/MocA family oxidoreductase [Firmicutes bacterium]|nr:Gfo/Idh/MocA family oxidoreductase [Bacillota bacterium]
MSNPIRLGIVGLGRAGRGMHLSEINNKKDKFKVEAVCDLIEERRNGVAAETGAKAYESIEQLINDPEIEIVDIATRSCDHLKHAMAALKAGKTVFLEKPICISYDEASELIAYAKTLGDHKLYIRHNRRFEGKFSHVKELADSGIIGEVTLVKLTRNSFSLRNDWQTISTFGGGQLLNWGPHVVDHALRFCGGDYTDLMADRRLVNASGDCEDHVKAMFKGINGAIVDMELICDCSYSQPEYLVYGTRGHIVDGGDVLKLKYLKPGTEKIRLEPDPGVPNGFGSNTNTLEWVEEKVPCRSDFGLTQTWDYMYEDFRNGKPYPITLDEALMVMKAIDDIKKKAPTIFY